jgi:hypothetical protein
MGDGIKKLKLPILPDTAQKQIEDCVTEAFNQIQEKKRLLSMAQKHTQEIVC